MWFLFVNMITLVFGVVLGWAAYDFTLFRQRQARKERKKRKGAKK